MLKTYTTEDTYAIDQVVETGALRLIVFEAAKDMPQCKSVKNIIEADVNDFKLLRAYIHDIDKIVSVSVEADAEILPADIYLRHQVIIAHGRIEYILDCYQAVKDAQQDLSDRELELEQAIQEGRL